MAQSVAGHEAWLLNRQTRQSLTLAIGDRLHDAILVNANSEGAEFMLGQQRFRVAVGRNLNDRTPVTQ
jgi:hypothetical protein